MLPDMDGCRAGLLCHCGYVVVVPRLQTTHYHVSWLMSIPVRVGHYIASSFPSNIDTLIQWYFVKLLSFFVGKVIQIIKLIRIYSSYQFNLFGNLAGVCSIIVVWQMMKIRECRKD